MPMLFLGVQEHYGQHLKLPGRDVLVALLGVLRYARDSANATWKLPKPAQFRHSFGLNVSGAAQLMNRIQNWDFPVCVHP